MTNPTNLIISLAKSGTARYFCQEDQFRFSSLMKAGEKIDIYVPSIFLGVYDPAFRDFQALFSREEQL